MGNIHWPKIDNFATCLSERRCLEKKLCHGPAWCLQSWKELYRSVNIENFGNTVNTQQYANEYAKNRHTRYESVRGFWWKMGNHWSTRRWTHRTYKSKRLIGTSRYVTGVMCSTSQWHWKPFSFDGMVCDLDSIINGLIKWSTFVTF